MGRVTFSIDILHDGTGHDTSSRCFINEANGYSPGDNGPNDGYVCTNDEVMYAITYSLEPGAEEQHDLSLTTPEPTSFQASSAFCSGGGAYPHTGVLAEDSAQTIACTMTFPETTQATTVTFNVFVNNVGITGAGDVESMVGVDLGGAVMHSDPVQWLTAPTADLVMQQPTISMAVVDGESGIKVSYPIGVINTGTPLDNHYQRGPFKGVAQDITVHDLSVTLPENLPSGYQVLSTSGFTETEPGLAATTTPINVTANDTLRNIATLDIFVPSSGLDGVAYWTAHIEDSTITQSDTNAPSIIENNFNKQPPSQPGQGQPGTFDTLGVWGRLAPRGDQGYVNNDWAQIIYNPTTMGLLTKVKYTDVNGDPGTLASTQNHRTGGPEGLLKLWNHFEVGSAPWVLEPYVFCDYWMYPAQEVVDPLRTIRVQVWDDEVGGYRPLAADAYTVYYRNSGTAPTNPTPDIKCGAPTDLAGWSTSPTDVTGGYPDAVKVVIDQLDLAVNNPIAAVIDIPVTSGPKTAYPNYPASTEVQNYANAHRGGVDSPEAWSTRNQTAKMSVVGTSANVSATADISELTTSATADHQRRVPVETRLQAQLASRYTLYRYVPGEPHIDYLKGSGTLSSCAVIEDPDTDIYLKLSDSYRDGRLVANPRLDVNGDPVTFTITYTEPDLGPDGLPCTEDDGHGWLIEWISTAPVDLDSSYTGRTVINVEFTIPDYARAGTTVTATATSYSTIYDKTGRGSNTSTVDLPGIVGQSKTVDTPREPVGNEITWTSYFFNNSTTTNYGSGRFMDVLPHDGDGRRGDVSSTMGAALSDVQITTTGSITAEHVYVTALDPTALVRDVNAYTMPEAGWCLLAEPTCLDGESATAYYVAVPSMPTGFYGTVQVRADTDGMRDGDILYNDMTPGVVDGMSQGVPAVGPVRTELYLPYQVLKFAEGGEPGGTGTPVKVNPDGTAEITYTVRVTNNMPGAGTHPEITDEITLPEGFELVGVTVSGEPLDPVSATFTIPAGALDPNEVVDYIVIVSVRAPDLATIDWVTVGECATDGPGDPTAGGFFNLVRMIDDADGPENNHACVPASPPGFPIVVEKYGANCDASGAPCALAGAQFAVFDADPTQPGAEPLLDAISVDETGVRFESTMLMVATDYWLVETKAPPGFNLLAAPIKFTVTADGIVLASHLPPGANISVSDKDAFTLVVIDTSSGELPLSGGTGPANHVVLALLLFGAAVVAHRRANRPPA